MSNKLKKKANFKQSIVMENTKLTPKEEKILAHLLKGKSNKEISTTLDISINTVKTHLKKVFKKKRGKV